MEKELAYPRVIAYGKDTADVFFDETTKLSAQIVSLSKLKPEIFTHGEIRQYAHYTAVAHRCDAFLSSAEQVILNVFPSLEFEKNELAYVATDFAGTVIGTVIGPSVFKREIKPYQKTRLLVAFIPEYPYARVDMSRISVAYYARQHKTFTYHIAVVPKDFGDLCLSMKKALDEATKERRALYERWSQKLQELSCDFPPSVCFMKKEVPNPGWFLVARISYEVPSQETTVKRSAYIRWHEPTKKSELAL